MKLKNALIGTSVEVKDNTLGFLPGIITGYTISGPDAVIVQFPGSTVGYNFWPEELRRVR